MKCLSVLSQKTTHNLLQICAEQVSLIEFRELTNLCGTVPEVFSMSMDKDKLKKNFSMLT